MEKGEAGADPSTGLFASLRTLGATLVAAAHDRLELISTEVEEERAWLLHLLLGTQIALFFCILGVLMLTLLVVVVFWDTHRVLVTLLLTVLYLGIGAVLAVAMRSKIRRKPRAFSASIAELAKDRQQLTGSDGHRRSD